MADSPRGRSGPPRPGSNRPRGNSGSAKGPKPGDGRSGQGGRSPERPQRSGGKDSPSRSHDRSSRGVRGQSGERAGRRDERDRSRSARESKDRVERPERLLPAAVYPTLDADVEPRQLDRFARRELSGLEKEEADFVANHLVMASRHVESEPALAHQHALAALSKGSRIAVVRETVGITAYLTGDFALALRELRTHRRLTGRDVNVPMMIDCERGLGRPRKGIELGNEVDRSTLEPAVAVELAIALSGARLDLGETERALWELHIPQLNPDRAFSYSPALFDAYAVVLEDLGRADEAAEWGRRADVAAEALRAAEDNPDNVVVLDLGEDDGEPLPEVSSEQAAPQQSTGEEPSA